ncbi:MAG: class I SAM-dependent DNA methyltransferase [Terriglobales bacterium]
MALSQSDLRIGAEQFSREWASARRERQDAQTFWNEFFQIFGVTRRRVASFEEPVKLLGDSRGSIDLLWPGVLIVEHKSAGEDLDRAHAQAIDYFPGIAESKLPRYVLVSDFQRFRLHDLETGEQKDFLLQHLSRNLNLFGFITGYQRTTFVDSDPVNVHAATKIGELHDQLYDADFRGHALEIFLVRIVYCLFADDTGIFQARDQFHFQILEKTRSDGSDLGSHLAYIFQILNTPQERRPATLDEELKTLPYVNGGLFSESLPIPTFDVHSRNLLLACFEFDWSAVSPAIFGSMFQAVMSRDPERRHAIGGHYTSEKNILKVLRGLFLDDLLHEFESIRHDLRALRAFNEKLGGLKLFDPACGCGNFLVIAYRELRQLEIKVLERIVELDPQAISDVTILCKIDVDQLTGIEIEENPAAIAEVATWITDHQMNQQLSETFGRSLSRLPLTKSARILRSNALRIDWRTLFEIEDIINGRVLVFGNPPFVAKANRNDSQNSDQTVVCAHIARSGVLDYVSCWFVKAAELLDGSRTRAAFVATNSITQGEQVGILWPYLRRRGMRTFFAHRTFKWQNEAPDQAAVFCVIIGFAAFDIQGKRIFEYESPDADPVERRVARVSPYLIEANEDLVVTSRTAPLCAVPEIRFGSMPNDGGGLLFSEGEAAVFLGEEPGARPYIRRFTGSVEFINGIKRYCLWLKDAAPSDLRRLPHVLRRLHDVTEHRRESNRPQTQALAATPALFGEDRQPTTRYILIPSVSSERRNYIPMSFMEPEVIASNLCLTIAGADLFHFGVLSSTMHMAWVRTVAGRLKGDYRYSNQIVYNNYPWPRDVSERARQRVVDAVDRVLEIRSRYADATLADLYDPLTMPADLLNAQHQLDRAVDRCYRATAFATESERVEYLFALYSEYSAPLTRRPRRARRQSASQ